MQVTFGQKPFSNLRPKGAQPDVAMRSNLSLPLTLPDWIPDAVRLYLDHTSSGLSLRFGAA